METFIDTFSGGGTGGSGGGGGTNSFGSGSTGGYEYNFSAVGGTGGDSNSSSMFQSSPWGSLSSVGFTSLEQVFRGSTGGNLARTDGNAASSGGDTSGGGMGGGAASSGGNTSGGGGASNSPEIATTISTPVSDAIESQRPLTSEESQTLAEDAGQLIQGSIDVTGSGEGNSSTSGDAPENIDITGSDEGNNSTSGDALLSGGSGDNSSISGFSIRSGLDSYFISAEFSNNFSEVPNNTGRDSVLPISSSGGNTGGSPFGGGMGSGNAPSDDMFGQSPWGRLEVVGIESFSGVFGGGGTSGGNPSGGL